MRCFICDLHKEKTLINRGGHEGILYIGRQYLHNLVADALGRS